MDVFSKIILKISTFGVQVEPGSWPVSYIKTFLARFQLPSFPVVESTRGEFSDGEFIVGEFTSGEFT